MNSGYLHPRRRAFTAGLCLMLCAVGAFSCLTHLTIYLDVEIFELNLLIEDLLVFAGYVLMSAGAFRVSPLLSSLGLGIITAERIWGLCSDLCFSEAQKTSEEIFTLVFVDVAEILGLVLGALVVLSQIKVFIGIKKFAEKCWLLPVMLLLISFVGSLFTNIGALTDATVGMFFLTLAVISFVLWCTDPAGVPRWIAQRLRENEDAEA